MKTVSPPSISSFFVEPVAPSEEDGRSIPSPLSSAAADDRPEVSAYSRPTERSPGNPEYGTSANSLDDLIQEWCACFGETAPQLTAPQDLDVSYHDDCYCALTPYESACTPSSYSDWVAPGGRIALPAGYDYIAVGFSFHYEMAYAPHPGHSGGHYGYHP